MSGFLEALVSQQESIVTLTANLTDDTFYLFLDKDGNKSRVEWMSSQFPSTTLPQLLFVTTDPRETWIQTIGIYYHCVDHNCGIDYSAICTNDSKQCQDIRRLDARFDWLPQPFIVFGNKPQPIQFVSDPCSKNIAGIESKLAWVELASLNGTCSLIDVVGNVEISKGSGVLLELGQGEDMFDFHCDTCENDGLYFTIPVSVVGSNKEASNSVRASDTTCTFDNRESENFFFAIDKDGDYQEMGWLLYPSFNFFIWLSQSFEYQQKLKEALERKSETSTIVQVFSNQVMVGDAGAFAVVDMPDISDLEFNKLELNFSMSCPGDTDTDCGQWDHTTQLFVCCPGNDMCGHELGRWITAFRRRTGHWLTNVSPLLPLLSQGECNFTAKHAPWAMEWLDSLTLIMSHEDVPAVAPYKTSFLWNGGTFNNAYNTIHSPINIQLTQSFKKLEIVAFITGHGSDNNGCGEFCPTSHVFQVNTINNFSVTFDTAGSPLGCTNLVSLGAVPNEHGTWLYGRDGWCDGLDVKPIVFDITNFVEPGSNVNLQYFALYKGETPDPKDNPGEIIMSSYLTYYQ